MAFNKKVSFESIKAQGGWASDAIWAYLFSHSESVSQVAQMFQQSECDLRLGANV